MKAFILLAEQGDVFMSPCKFYRVIPERIDEIGGGSPSTLIYQRPSCYLQQLVTVDEWENCKTSPYEGPCWDMKDQFKTPEEWENWVRNRIETLTRSK
jgi:hypothetical protein